MVDRDAAAQSMPESGLPRWWWPLSAAYLGYLAWLAAGTRVFLDQVWVTEYGRRLRTWPPHSMYMLPDGSSALPASFLGPIIAELSFRLSGGLARLSPGQCPGVVGHWLGDNVPGPGLGASRRMSALLGCAVLFDATLVQSVVLGRPDALAISFAVGGMALVSTAGSSPVAYRPRLATARRNGLRSVRTGALHLGQRGAARSAAGAALAGDAGSVASIAWAPRQIHRSGCRPVPGVVFLIFVVLPYLAAMLRDFSAFDRYFIAAVSQIPFTSYLFQVTSPSVVLVLAGAFGVFGCRSLPVAVTLVVGMAVILFSGFYPFRVPYLVVYLAAATAFAVVANVSVVASRAWERLVGLAVLTAVLLLFVRGMLHMGNERVPMAADSFLVDLPKDQVVADFSWDLYVPARLLGVPVIRSFPGMESSGVRDWLKLTGPDLVVRSAIAAQSWIMVEDDLDSLLEAGGYCQSTTVDWSGNEAAAGWVTSIPSPMLWRLGRTAVMGRTISGFVVAKSRTVSSLVPRCAGFAKSRSESSAIESFLDPSQ